MVSEEGGLALEIYGIAGTALPSPSWGHIQGMTDV